MTLHGTSTVTMRRSNRPHWGFARPSLCRSGCFSVFFLSRSGP